MSVSTQQAITNVFGYLTYHKGEAVEALFLHSHPDFHKEWMARDIHGFWMHLDNGKRLELTTLANEQYKGM